MGNLLERAIEEIESERRWDQLFSQPPLEALKRMAEEALADHRAGRTTPLDPERPEG